ncbi:MAG TPA: winged helix-turn-helix domain-containing protein [Thermoplasmata archaeon]|nr:winged helix-turn-helix domain-containing protein [Thermoplasmata archaeon]
MTPSGRAPPKRARRRASTDLYASVLEVVKRLRGAARVTRVSYGAGMPVDRLRAVLGHLLALGLLTQLEIEGHPAYELTPRGQEFLDTYWKMRGFVEGLDRAYAMAGPPEERVRPPSPRNVRGPPP